MEYFPESIDLASFGLNNANPSFYINPASVEMHHPQIPISQQQPDYFIRQSHPRLPSQHQQYHHHQQRPQQHDFRYNLPPNYIVVDSQTGAYYTQHPNAHYPINPGFDPLSLNGAPQSQTPLPSSSYDYHPNRYNEISSTNTYQESDQNIPRHHQYYTPVYPSRPKTPAPQNAPEPVFNSRGEIHEKTLRDVIPAMAPRLGTTNRQFNHPLQQPPPQMMLAYQNAIPSAGELVICNNATNGAESNSHQESASQALCNPVYDLNFLNESMSGHRENPVQLHPQLPPPAHPPHHTTHSHVLTPTIDLNTTQQSNFVPQTAAPKTSSPRTSQHSARASILQCDQATQADTTDLELAHNFEPTRVKSAQIPTKRATKSSDKNRRPTQSQGNQNYGEEIKDLAPTNAPCPVEKIRTKKHQPPPLSIGVDGVNLHRIATTDTLPDFVTDMIASCHNPSPQLTPQPNESFVPWSNVSQLNPALHDPRTAELINIFRSISLDNSHARRSFSVDDSQTETPSTPKKRKPRPFSHDGRYFPDNERPTSNFERIISRDGRPNSFNESRPTFQDGNSTSLDDSITRKSISLERLVAQRLRKELQRPVSFDGSIPPKSKCPENIFQSTWSSDNLPQNHISLPPRCSAFQEMPTIRRSNSFDNINEMRKEEAYRYRQQRKDHFAESEKVNSEIMREIIRKARHGIVRENTGTYASLPPFVLNESVNFSSPTKIIKDKVSVSHELFPPPSQPNRQQKTFRLVDAFSESSKIQSYFDDLKTHQNYTPNNRYSLSEGHVQRHTRPILSREEWWRSLPKDNLNHTPAVNRTIPQTPSSVESDFDASSKSVRPNRSIGAEDDGSFYKRHRSQRQQADTRHQSSVLGKKTTKSIPHSVESIQRYIKEQCGIAGRKDTPPNSVLKQRNECSEDDDRDGVSARTLGHFESKNDVKESKNNHGKDEEVALACENPEDYENGKNEERGSGNGEENKCASVDLSHDSVKTSLPRGGDRDREEFPRHNHRRDRDGGHSRNSRYRSENSRHQNKPRRGVVSAGKISIKDKVSSFIKELKNSPSKDNSIQMIENTLTSCHLGLKSEYHVDVFQPKGNKPMFYGSLRLSGVFLGRASGLSKKSLKHKVYDIALDVLTSKSVDEILALGDRMKKGDGQIADATTDGHFTPEHSGTKLSDRLHLLQDWVRNNQKENVNAILHLQSAFAESQCNIAYSFNKTPVYDARGVRLFNKCELIADGKVMTSAIGVGWREAKAKVAEKIISDLLTLDVDVVHEKLMKNEEKDIEEEIREARESNAEKKRVDPANLLNLLINKLRSHYRQYEDEDYDGDDDNDGQDNVFEAGESSVFSLDGEHREEEAREDVEVTKMEERREGEERGSQRVEIVNGENAGDDETMDQNIDGNIDERVDGTIDQQINEDVDQGINENAYHNNIDENIDQNIEHNIDRNIKEHIDLNVGENIDQEIDLNIGQNIEDIGRNIDETIHDNINVKNEESVSDEINENVKENVVEKNDDDESDDKVDVIVTVDVGQGRCGDDDDGSGDCGVCTVESVGGISDGDDVVDGGSTKDDDVGGGGGGGGGDGDGGAKGGCGSNDDVDSLSIKGNDDGSDVVRGITSGDEADGDVPGNGCGVSGGGGGGHDDGSGCTYVDEDVVVDDDDTVDNDNDSLDDKNGQSSIGQQHQLQRHPHQQQQQQRGRPQQHQSDVLLISKMCIQLRIKLTTVFKKTHEDITLDPPPQVICQVYLAERLLATEARTSRREAQDGAFRAVRQTLMKAQTGCDVMNTFPSLNPQDLKGEDILDVVHKGYAKITESNRCRMLRSRRKISGVDKRSRDVSDLIILEHEDWSTDRVAHAHCILNQSASMSGLLLEWTCEEDYGVWRCEICLQGKDLSRCVAKTKRDALTLASVKALFSLYETQPVVKGYHAKSYSSIWVSRDELHKKVKVIIPTETVIDMEGTRVNTTDNKHAKDEISHEVEKAIERLVSEFFHQPTLKELVSAPDWTSGERKYLRHLAKVKDFRCGTEDKGQGDIVVLAMRLDLAQYVDILKTQPNQSQGRYRLLPDSERPSFNDVAGEIAVNDSFVGGIRSDPVKTWLSRSRARAEKICKKSTRGGAKKAKGDNRITSDRILEDWEKSEEYVTANNSLAIDNDFNSQDIICISNKYGEFVLPDDSNNSTDSYRDVRRDEENGRKERNSNNHCDEDQTEEEVDKNDGTCMHAVIPALRRFLRPLSSSTPEGAKKKKRRSLSEGSASFVEIV